MPQILVKSIIRRNLKQMFHLGKYAGHKLLFRLALVIHLSRDIRKLHQNGIFWHISVNQQSGNNLVHFSLLRPCLYLLFSFALLTFAYVYLLSLAHFFLSLLFLFLTLMFIPFRSLFDPEIVRFSRLQDR